MGSNYNVQEIYEDSNGNESATREITIELTINMANFAENAARREGKSVSDLVGLILMDYQSRS